MKATTRSLPPQVRGGAHVTGDDDVQAGGSSAKTRLLAQLNH